MSEIVQRQYANVHVTGRKSNKVVEQDRDSQRKEDRKRKTEQQDESKKKTK